jgi:ribosomal protein L23
VIEADAASKDIVRQAIRQAFERGLINRKQISTADMKDAVRKLFEVEVRRVTQ